MKKTKKNEVIEAETVEVEELDEHLDDEGVEPEEPKKESFWKRHGKKILVGAGVLGGVAIAALGMLGVNHASEALPSFDSDDWYDDEDEDDDSEDDAEETNSEETSEE